MFMVLLYVYRYIKKHYTITKNKNMKEFDFEEDDDDDEEDDDEEEDEEEETKKEA
jgi:ABC-type Zn2+ transport system substrate-binding protein/surface adhesin